MIKLFEFISNENNQLLDFLKKNQKGIIDDMFIELVSKHIVNIHQCGQFVQGIRERETLFSWLYYWRDFIYEQRGAFPEYTDILPSDKTHKPAEIFLCYGHEADKQQVESLYKELIQVGHNPWLASQDTLPSDDITLTVNQAIQRADFGLICVSGEETTPAEHAQIEQLLSSQTEISIEIIIIRLADFTIPEAWQDFRQIALLEDDDNAELLKAVEVLQEREQEEQGTRKRDSESRIIFPPGGTMNPKSKFYIERETDRRCWQLLSNINQAACTIVIQSPIETGKSSLMVRLINHVQNNYDIKRVLIDLQSLPLDGVSSKEFFRSICSLITDELDLDDKIDSYWTDNRNVIQNCNQYLTQYIIPTVQKPIVLAIDEVNRVVTSPFKNDFFSMLNSWYDARGIDENFAKLSLIVVLSTEPYIAISSLNEIPNLKAQLKVQLDDFNLNQIQDFSERLKFPLKQEQLKQIFDLLNGHPFLTYKALYDLATQQVDFDTLFTQAITEEGLFFSHLDRLAQHVAKQPELRKYLSKICESPTQIELDENFDRLKRAGILRENNGQVLFRNNLYQAYFCQLLSR